MKKLLVIALFVAVSISAAELYGTIYKGCDKKFYVLWTNIPSNFVLQKAENLTNWSDLVEIRRNRAMTVLQHPLENTNHVRYYRLAVIQ